MLLNICVGGSKYNLLSKFSRFLGSSKPIKLEFSRWLQIRMLRYSRLKFYPTKTSHQHHQNIIIFFIFKNRLGSDNCNVIELNVQKPWPPEKSDRSAHGFDPPKDRNFRTIIDLIVVDWSILDAYHVRIAHTSIRTVQFTFFFSYWLEVLQLLMTVIFVINLFDNS